ncbi:glycoside hydrolase [Lutibacter sp. HS1-25]|uniref:glycoside hydrolase family 43 protein n=1 Tax=Lutibacter sp. HS1-25 TaxID=2485000 RepID=UPI001011334C|nr:glycoside hydrolase family 43 protein [Lutibacter sp. HS1-25]RXP62732.1 glycoside hydrolase [Lutibacter sp. HS1-25]
MKKYFYLYLVVLSVTISCKAQSKFLDEIRVRDPYILADVNAKKYYLYVQTANRLDDNDTIKGVEVYESKNLKDWTGPKTVFSASENHWGKRMIWAPEVHYYNNKYYLFVTFTGDEMQEKEANKPEQYQRGTQILVANNPEGPFEPFSNKPTTPGNWMSLDGTLWVEEGIPYMIFCHEWAQIEDGTMEIIELKNDLSESVGEPQTLFNATDAKWVKSLSSTGFKYHGYVTDGCFIYKTNTGKLLMIWSSFGENGYGLGQLISESGSVKGPWKQIDKLIFKENGGHGMIFKTFEGKLMIALHQPNNGQKERTQLYELLDRGNYLELGDLQN